MVKVWRSFCSFCAAAVFRSFFSLCFCCCFQTCSTFCFSNLSFFCLSLIFLARILFRIICIFLISTRFAAFASLFVFFNWFLTWFKSVFFKFRRFSFIFFSIFLFYLPLFLRVFFSLLFSTFLYSDNNNQYPQLFFCAFSAALAVTMLSKFLIFCSNRRKSFCSSKIEEFKAFFLLRHRV